MFIRLLCFAVYATEWIQTNQCYDCLENIASYTIVPHQ